MRMWCGRGGWTRGDERTRPDRGEEPARTKGTPFYKRSLPAEYADLTLYEYEVIQPVPALEGTTAAWFNQPGGGTQYLFSDSLESLVNQKRLRRIE